MIAVILFIVYAIICLGFIIDIRYFNKGKPYIQHRFWTLMFGIVLLGSLACAAVIYFGH